MLFYYTLYINNMTSIEIARKKLAKDYAKSKNIQKAQNHICDVCDEDITLHKYCGTSGIVHVKSTNSIGSVVFPQNKTTFTSNELMSAINTNKIKWQSARIKKVIIDNDSINLFQSYNQHRYGILYGIVGKSNDVIHIHSIYEPPQILTENGVELINNTDSITEEKNVDKIASMLNLQRVGIIITQTVGGKMSGKEILLGAKEQSKFGDHCVVITLARNANMQADVWQMSQQCTNLYKDGLLVGNDSGFIQSTIPMNIPMEMTNFKTENKDEPKTKTGTKIDVHWFYAPVAIELMESTIINNKFARINREENVTIENFNIYMKKRKDQHFLDNLKDFHVLIFLMKNAFDIKIEMPEIINAILLDDKKIIKTHIKTLKVLMKS